jgi:FkbM family methyltransferase
MNTADSNVKVKEIYEKFILDTFHKPASEFKVIIYGIELQICGGILKYIPDIDVLLCSDLKIVDRVFDGRTVYLPEMLVPYKENTIVLVSLLYEYEYEKAVAELQKYGIPSSNIAHGRPLAESVLNVVWEWFAAVKMDLKVKELFDKIGKNISEIKYMDIGANNYLFYNNTYLFYKAGASGVLVEANPDFYDVLRANRPRDIVLNCGCSPDDANETLTYYKTTRAGHNTFIKENFSNKVKSGEISIIDKIEIPMRSIQSIIKEFFPEKHVDYISIDIEGMDTAVINSIDLTDIRVDVILIEMRPDSLESRNLYLKLHKLGYGMKYQGIGGEGDFLFFRNDLFNS